MAHRWERSVIRVQSGCNHDKEFNLKWWRLNVTRENGFGRYERDGYSGITITGFSDPEYHDIITWCQENGVFRIGKVNSFDDSVGTNRISSIPNSEGLLHFRYREREFGVFGLDHNICNLESYLSSTTPRNLEAFIHGLPRNEIKRICKGLNHRFLDGTASGGSSDKVIAVSLDDNRTYLELYLRSRNGVEVK